MNLDYRKLALLLYPAVFIACALAFVCACAPAWSAPGSKAKAKAYSPFDEPKPRTPKEFATDARLDQRVKVFCKSRNLRDLFANLSAKTGVKITAAKEVSSQRAIVFFHDRPLRDVLTEISAIHGFHWLVSGKSGAYEYELFEDTVREKRRAQAPAELKAAQDGLLLDFLDTLLGGGPDAEDALNTLEQTDPLAYRNMTSESQKSVGNALASFGSDFLSGVLANGPAALRYGDLSPTLQGALCDCCNQQVASVPPNIMTDGAREQGLDFKGNPAPTPCSPADLANATVQVQSATGADGQPRFGLQILNVNGPGSLSFNMEWPSRMVTPDTMRVATGRRLPETISTKTELPDETKITITDLRWLPNRKGLLLGDLLEGIALQSGKDVIGDYYLQDKSVGGVTALTLKGVIELACKQFGYTCQADGNTLRLRHNKWFMQAIHTEPPASLVESLWATILRNGALTVRDLAPVASLSDDQRMWPGWKFVPGSAPACTRPCAVSLFSSLSEAEEKSARGGGLPVSELSGDQRRKVDAFAVECGGAGLSRESIGSGMIAMNTARPQITTTESGVKIMSYSDGTNPRSMTGAGGMTVPKLPAGNPGTKRIVTMTGPAGAGIDLDAFRSDPVAALAQFNNSIMETISLVTTDPLRTMPASLSLTVPLSDSERKEIAAQGKADAEAEKTEVVRD